MPVRAEGGQTPQLADDVFIAPNAEVIGDVQLAEHASVWFSSIVRGDGAPVSLGAGVDIQDNSVVDSQPGQPCSLGDYTSLGHAAKVHSSRVGSHVLVEGNIFENCWKADQKGYAVLLTPSNGGQAAWTVMTRQ